MSSEKLVRPVTVERIAQMIFLIRGHKVMLVPDSTNPKHQPQTYDARTVQVRVRGVVTHTYLKAVQ